MATVVAVALAGVDADVAWPAFAALGVAGARLVISVSSPTLGALAGAAAAATALRLPPSGASGTTAVVVGLAFGLIAVSALTRTPRRTRRRVLQVSGAVAGAATMATVALGVAVLGARGSVREATADFATGLQASRMRDTNDHGFTSVLLGEMQLSEALQAVQSEGPLRLAGRRPVAPQPRGAPLLTTGRRAVDLAEGRV